MFTTRPHQSAAAKARQPQKLIDITTTNADIPLQENWSERWCTLNKGFEHIMQSILEFDLRKDDVFVVTFMKCGTTWMQEAAWLLLNNLDYELAGKSSIMERSIFIDSSGIFPELGNSIEACKNKPSPRLIKTHLPANLVPQQIWQKRQKTIYVARNVKDVVVSAFHFIQGFSAWSGSMDEFVDDFMNNELWYTPFWAHIVDFWKMRNEPFIFFVTYEEMKRDLSKVLNNLSVFLGTPQLNEEQMKSALRHLSFASMKHNKQTSMTADLKDAAKNMPLEVKPNFRFMRRGIVGSFKDELTAEHCAKLDAWSAAFLSKHGIKEEDIFGKV